MRVFDPAIAAVNAAQNGRVAVPAFWFQGVNRATDEVETLGLWLWSESRTITVDGQDRLYRGGAGLLNAPTFTAEVGLDVRNVRVDTAPFVTAVETAVRGYDLTRQPAELHTVYLDPRSHVTLGAVREVAGRIVKVEITSAPDGGQSTAEIVLQSAAYRLAEGLALKASDATQGAVYPGDRFFRHAVTTGTTYPVVWGNQRVAGTSQPRTPRPATSRDDPHWGP